MSSESPRFSGCVATFCCGGKHGHPCYVEPVAPSDAPAEPRKWPIGKREDCWWCGGANAFHSTCHTCSTECFNAAGEYFAQRRAPLPEAPSPETKAGFGWVGRTALEKHSGRVLLVRVWLKERDASRVIGITEVEAKTARIADAEFNPDASIDLRARYLACVRADLDEAAAPRDGSTAGATPTPFAIGPRGEDDPYDRLRLLVSHDFGSDGAALFTAMHARRLDALLREHHALRAALSRLLDTANEGSALATAWTNAVIDLVETLSRWSRAGCTDDQETPLDDYGKRVLSMVIREVQAIQSRIASDSRRRAALQEIQP